MKPLTKDEIWDKCFPECSTLRETWRKAMQEYAELYHQEKIREELIAFLEKTKLGEKVPSTAKIVDEYLKQPIATATEAEQPVEPQEPKQTAKEIIECPNPDCKKSMELCSVNYMCPDCHTMLNGAEFPDPSQLHSQPEMPSDEDVMLYFAKHHRNSRDMRANYQVFTRGLVLEFATWFKSQLNKK